MMLCSNRPEGFVRMESDVHSLERLLIYTQGPLSHLYGHILTSCFLDTILVPLCTWLYLLWVVSLALLGSSRRSAFVLRAHKTSGDVEVGDRGPKRSRRIAHKALSVLYYLLLLAQVLMCVLEITRLSLAHLGIGLLPFTFVSLILAFALHLTHGFRGKVHGWEWANVAVFIALAITNGVKIAEEVKEGIDQRKGTKYPESDEIIDVAVMVGVYAALAVLETVLRPREAYKGS